MNRINAVGFLLKVFSIKPRKPLFSYRIAGSGLLLAIVSLNSLLMPSCVTQFQVGDVHQDHLLKEYEFENVRFEPLDSAFSLLPIQPARAYWLKRGEKVAVRLDTFEVHWEHVGAMCDFSDNASAGNCQICDYCSPPPSYSGPPCFDVTTLLGNWFNIVVDSGFIQTGNPKQVIGMGPREILGACNRSPNPVPVFEPEESGLFRTTPDPPDSRNVIIKSETDGEIKLHVVEKGLTQKVAYPLTRQTVDGTDYWMWTMEGSPLWLENFSPDLRVTDIRIFRGVCADGSTQGKQCLVPNESAPVKPSHIFFLPDFQGTVSGHLGESSHRCYSSPNASDGNFINLDICRERSDYPLTQTVQKRATPAYESDPARPTERLTWAVAFNVNEGADADLTQPGIQAMQPEARLIIEFTIQAMP